MCNLWSQGNSWSEWSGHRVLKDPVRNNVQRHQKKKVNPLVKKMEPLPYLHHYLSTSSQEKDRKGHHSQSWIQIESWYRSFSGSIVFGTYSMHL